MIKNEITKETVLFATDTARIDYNFTNIKYFLVECNWCWELLMYEDKFKKNRILKTHMGLDYLIQFLRRQDLRNTKEIILLHLSKTNSLGNVFADIIQKQTSINTRLAKETINVNNNLIESQRFLIQVGTQWEAEFNNTLKFSEYQKTLAQHLFLKINNTFAELNAKWKKNKENKEISWKNINLNKLMLDSVHIVNLKLDGLLKNHLHIVPFWNTSKGQFDVNLQPGYLGKLYYHCEMAIDRPIDVRFELVYETDIFQPKKKNYENEIETYDFQITQPFNRGNIVGGFGYIVYTDNAKNKLVILTESDFKKSEGFSKQKYFWDNNPKEMRLKTLVHRTVEHIQLDPEKINTSYLEIENQIEQPDEEAIVENFDDLVEDDEDVANSDTQNNEPGF